MSELRFIGFWDLWDLDKQYVFDLADYANLHFRAKLKQDDFNKFSLRFTVAYYLLLLYVTVMLKPLMPIISDAWSHEFNETEHISLVHAKYGSHHLQKEVADSGSDNDRAKSQNILKSGKETSFHVARQMYKHDFSLNNNEIQYPVFKPGKLPFVLISNLAPPPKFS